MSEAPKPNPHLLFGLYIKQARAKCLAIYASQKIVPTMEQAELDTYQQAILLYMDALNHRMTDLDSLQKLMERIDHNSDSVSVLKKAMKHFPYLDGS